MTVEGNWIIGAMQSDYPKIPYEVVPLPAGPSGKHGTLVFTNCWGIAAGQQVHSGGRQFRQVPGVTGPTAQVRQRLRRDAIPAVRRPGMGEGAHDDGGHRHGDTQRFRLHPRRR